ncbi:UNVERIFIED_CONTAM: hypothetical protein HDU68_010958 [Siphonaria sp. JEL0065]|nr:hypothetical protein HDU68_010958 [Siphonaria sp. JEL0065]
MAYLFRSLDSGGDFMGREDVESRATTTNDILRILEMHEGFFYDQDEILRYITEPTRKGLFPNEDSKTKNLPPSLTEQQLVLDVYSEGELEEIQTDDTIHSLVIDPTLPLPADLLLIQQQIIGVAQPEPEEEIQPGQVSVLIDRTGDLPEAAVSAQEAESSDSEVSDFVFSDSDSESEAEETEEGEEKAEKKKKFVKVEEDDDFDDDTGVASKQALRTKNEVELPPIEKLDIIIPPTAALTEIGQVFALVDDTMVIESTVCDVTLDADSILCSSSRKVIGKVFETFGPVIQPMYSVRYDVKAIPKEERVNVGDHVYFVKEMAKYVFAAQLRLLKGSDASNRDDEEVAAEELEFSDDEKEMEYKRAVRQQKEMRKRHRHGNASDEEGQLDNDNAESRLNPRSARRGGRERGGGRGGRGGFTEGRRLSHDEGVQGMQRSGRGGRGGFDGTRGGRGGRGGNQQPNYHPQQQPITQRPVFHGLPPKPHALPPRPTVPSVASPAAPIPSLLPTAVAPPIHLGGMNQNPQQLIAFMHQQQLQLQQQHQQQLMYAAAALQAHGVQLPPNMLSSASGNDGNSPIQGSFPDTIPFNPMNIMMGASMMYPQMMMGMQGSMMPNTGGAGFAAGNTMNGGADGFLQPPPSGSEGNNGNNMQG